jgi:hypothetical protein
MNLHTEIEVTCWGGAVLTVSVRAQMWTPGVLTPNHVSFPLCTAPHMSSLPVSLSLRSWGWLGRLSTQRLWAALIAPSYFSILLSLSSLLLPFSSPVLKCLLCVPHEIIRGQARSQYNCWWRRTISVSFPLSKAVLHGDMFEFKTISCAWSNPVTCHSKWGLSLRRHWRGTSSPFLSRESALLRRTLRKGLFYNQPSCKGRAQSDLLFPLRR